MFSFFWTVLLIQQQPRPSEHLGVALDRTSRELRVRLYLPLVAATRAPDHAAG
jgi:hypothetical protein